MVPMSNETPPSKASPPGSRKIDILLVVGVMCLVLPVFATYQSLQNRSQIESDYLLIKQLQENAAEGSEMLGTLGERLRNIERATVGDGSDAPEETLALIRRDLQEVNKRIGTAQSDEMELRKAVQRLVRGFDKLKKDVAKTTRRPAPPVVDGPGLDFNSLGPQKPVDEPK